MHNLDQNDDEPSLIEESFHDSDDESNLNMKDDPINHDMNLKGLEEKKVRHFNSDKDNIVSGSQKILLQSKEKEPKTDGAPTNKAKYNKAQIVKFPSKDTSLFDEYWRISSDSIRLLDRDSLQSAVRALEILKNPGLILNRTSSLKNYQPLNFEFSLIEKLDDFKQPMKNQMSKEKLLKHFALLYIKESDWYVLGMDNELTMQVYHMSKFIS